MDTQSTTKRTLIICTTARSGSNLLCNYLTNTRAIGKVGEILNPDVIRSGFAGIKFSAEETVSMTGYLKWARENFSSRSGIFALKLLYEDFDKLKTFRAVIELFHEANVIFLRRRSKVEQAISYYLAQQTGKWVFSDSGIKDAKQVTFDYDRLNNIFRTLANQEVSWVRWFEILQVRYHEIWHEDFVDRPEAELRTLFSTMGIEWKDFPIESSLKKQSNHVNGEFYTKFLEFSIADLGKGKDIVEYKKLTFGP